MAIGDAQYANALDTRQLAALRGATQGKLSPEAAREVAQQFESLFVQSLMKSMRSASIGDDLFSSNATDEYQGLFDQQLASNLSHGQGLGLAPLIERQLMAQQGLDPDAGKELDRSITEYPRQPARFPVDAAPLPDASAVADQPRREALWSSPEEFVRDLWPQAQHAADELGVSPRALLAQAALETGWGRHVLRDGSGRSSHNLFNIKAHRDWNGETVRVPTLEYRQGVPERETAEFRAYDSVEAAFRDYVAFLRDTPRYAEALEAGDDEAGFVRALEAAGYATDPRYAEKLTRILDGDRLSAAEPAVKIPPRRSTT